MKKKQQQLTEAEAREYFRQVAAHRLFGALACGAARAAAAVEKKEQKEKKEGSNE